MANLVNEYDLNDKQQWIPTGRKIDQDTGEIYNAAGELVGIDEDVLAKAQARDDVDTDAQAKDAYLKGLSEEIEQGDGEDPNDWDDVDDMTPEKAFAAGVVAMAKHQAEQDDMTQVIDLAVYRDANFVVTPLSHYDGEETWVLARSDGSVLRKFDNEQEAAFHAQYCSLEYDGSYAENARKAAAEAWQNVLADLGVDEIEESDMVASDEMLLAQDFGHIQNWDEAVQEGINLREEVDAHRWKLADYLRWILPTTSSGRPQAGAEDKTLSAIAGAIGEDRSVCSQLRANGMFWTREYRRDVPAEISYRQMAKARVESGWRPGKKPPTDEQRKRAQVILGKMAEGEWENTKKARSVSAHDYARRCYMSADKALATGELGDDVAAYFRTIRESAEDLMNMLDDDEASEGG